MAFFITAALAALVASASAKMVWNPITTSVGDQRHNPRASTFVKIEGNVVPTEYKVLARTGDVIQGVTYGAYVNKAGLTITSPQAGSTVSNSADYVSLLNVKGATPNTLYSITHLESSAPASTYLSKIRQNPSDGSLKVVSTSAIDWSAWGNVWNPCAGSVTPWETHLGSEESEPNARLYTADLVATWKTTSVVKSLLAYQGVDVSGTISDDDAKNNFFPYKYGYVWEATVDPATEKASVVKHLAMGRNGIEMALVLPDKKTVLINIDGNYKPHLMFIADAANDLSAGCLFASKLEQTSDVDGGAFTVSWMRMDCAKDSELLQYTTLRFDDIFYSAALVNGACPTASDPSIVYKRINSGSNGIECLAVKAGQEKAAIYMETTRSAALMGATTEWNKWEGMAYDSKRNRVYFSITSVSNSMKDVPADPANTIRLPENVCGCVYYMDLTPPTATPAYYGTYIKALVCGAPNAAYVAPVPNPPATDSPQDLDLNNNNSCDLDRIASPDNLAYIPGHDGLLIAEDTSGHQNDILWYYDLADASLTRVFSTPFGSEVTGSSWFRDINGFAYLVTVIQKPYGDASNKATDPLFTGFGAYVGYIGINLETSGLTGGLPRFGDTCDLKVNGPASVCNDGNACTKDTCVPPSSKYSYLPRCSNVATPACKGCSSVADCNDDNACTNDVCTPAGRCTNRALLNCFACKSAADCPVRACKTLFACTVAGKCLYKNVPNCTPPP